MRPPAAHHRLGVSLLQQRERGVPQLAEHHARTPEQRETLRAQGAQAIMDGMKRLGASNPTSLQDENGFLHFPVGSIQCTLGIVTLEERDLFLVYAPIMDLPSDRDLILPLYRLLLELNNRFELSIAKFGLHGDTIFLSAMRPVDGLDPTEVEDMVRWVSGLADDIDDRLLVEFGGTSRRRGG